MSFWSRTAVIGTALLLAGCVSASRTRYPYFLAAGHAGAPGVETCLVTPLNFNMALPQHLLDAAEPADAALHAFLQERGRKTERVGLRDVLERWGQAARSVGSLHDVEGRLDSERYLAAMRSLVAELSRDRAVDAVVVARLEQRRARGFGQGAMWDGVLRALPRVNDEENDITGSWSGTFSGLSLHVEVYTPQGDRVFESYGGLDLIQQADMAIQQLTLRDDLLADAELVREGIAIAFDPYLPLSAP